jgi:hypothetical protein
MVFKRMKERKKRKMRKKRKKIFGWMKMKTKGRVKGGSRGIVVVVMVVA